MEIYYGANPGLFAFARQMRINPTEAEKHLWSCICEKKLNGLRFRRQHPIAYFIADFYCHSAKLVIEVDGGIHRQGEQYQYDLNRDRELRELGLTVLRFTNEEVMGEIESVLAKIVQVVHPQTL
jgi:very-short-patch-repair endonuclease